MPRRSSWYFAAYVALIGVAGPIAACSSSGSSSEAIAQNAAAPPPQQPAAPSPSTQQAGAFTDAQVRGYALAHAEIAPIGARLDTMTDAERAQATAQIQAILARNGITADLYNQISSSAQTDQDLRQRIAGQTPATYTDDQLRAFASAAVEIEGLNRSLANATEAERAAASSRVADILRRNSLDGQTYNNIAARAQVDEALAARIQALYSAQRTQQQ